MEEYPELPLPGLPREKKIEVIEIENKEKVLLRGWPYMSWECGDEIARRTAIVQIHELGLATQEELSDTFQLHIRSTYNYLNAYHVVGYGAS